MKGKETERPASDVKKDMQAVKRRLRILVVENDVDTRHFFKLYLEQLGHTADAAAGVGEALSALSGSRYDVLFADIGLADGSGWDLMEQANARSIPRPVFSIAMTGYGLAEDLARSQAAGFRHHVMKPVDPSKVKALLDEASRELLAAD